jgi:ligand-binding sensor domain-containing protein
MKRTWRIAPIVVGLVLAASIGFVLWEARHAFQQSAAEIAASSESKFQTISLEPVVPSGMESFAAPDDFTDAVEFGGNLYLSSPGGIFVYGPDGALKKSYRAGLELPASPVVAMATGVAGAQELGLWAATSGAGLLRFDGNRFTQILPNDPAVRSLTALMPLSTGRILLGTEKRGLLVFDGKRLSKFHDSLRDLRVTALAGSESEIWVGTLERGVLRWHAGQVDSISEENGLPDKQVLSLVASGSKTYIGTANGIAEIESGKISRTFAPGAFARTMLLQGDHLLVGTMEQGTLDVALKVSRAASVRPVGAAQPARVDRLIALQDKTYALANNGLYASTQRGGGWKQVLKNESSLLSDRNISALSLDPAGKLWVGYFDRGLDVIDLAGRRTTHIENDRVFCINRIVQDPAKNLALVATANGLVVMDSSGRTEQVLTKQDGLIADHITDVALLQNANSGSLSAMAIATPAGITFLDSTGARSLYAFHGLVNNHAYSLGVSDKGNSQQLMVGTLGGMSVLQGGVVRANYTTANSGLRHNWITALVPVGDEWFAGTYGVGVLRMTSSSAWEIFADMPRDVVVNPNALVVTATHVFAGTLDRGLWVFDREHQRWMPVVAGLPSLNVTALAARDGNLFVGTDNGLVRMNENEIRF